MEPLPSRVIPKRPGRQKPKPKRHWLKALGVLAVVGIVFDIILLALQIGLPSVDDVRAQTWPEASWVMASDGRVLGELYQDRRRTVAPGDLPVLLRSAFVAAHDPAFLSRSPLTVSDLVSAYFRSGSRADGHPGGLSVPLAYGILPKPKGTYARMRAWLLARRLENGLSKDELLTLYLNRVDLGEGGHGVEEGALHFFSRRASELGPTQVALLASIPPRPSARSPRGPAEVVMERRNLVLDRMVKLDSISSIEVIKEKDSPLGLQIFHADPSVFLQSVRTRLRGKLGREKLATAGLTIDVSQDVHVQPRLQTALRDAAMRADELSGWRGPLSTLDAAVYGSVRDRVLGKAAGILDLSGALPFLAGGNLEAIASAAKALPLEAGQVAVGRVAEVLPAEIKVDLGSVTARISADEASWATVGIAAAAPPPVKKGGKQRETPPTGVLDRLVHPGDLVWVRLLAVPKAETTLAPGHLSQRGAFDAAGLVVDNDTGRILGMVGGVSPDSGHFDRARNLVRPVGAGMEMLTFSLGLDSGDLTASTLLDRPAGLSPTLWDGDTPGEDDARERKRITAFEAFATHDVGGNAAVVNRVGAASVLATVQQLGFRKTTAPWLLKGALGSPLALANAWTVLGNSGTAEAPHTIDDVLDSSAKRIWASVDTTSAIIKQSTVDLMRHWLVAVSPSHEEVLPSHLGLDTWCAGRVGKLIAAVWVGPNRVAPGLRPIPGDGPARQAFHEMTSGETRFELGESVSTTGIDPDTGLLSKDADARQMPFLPGTAPEATAPHHAPHRHANVKVISPRKKGGHR